MNRSEHRRLVRLARRFLAKSGASDRVAHVREVLLTSEFANRFDAERRFAEALAPMRNLEQVRSVVCRVLASFGCDLRDVLITLAWSGADPGKAGKLRIDANETIESATAALELARRQPTNREGHAQCR